MTNKPAEPSPEVAPTQMKHKIGDTFGGYRHEPDDPAVAPRDTQPEPVCRHGINAMHCKACDLPCRHPVARVEDSSPATQHRVIPVEWHRVAVEPQSPGWLQRNAERVRAERLRIDEALAPAAQPASTDARQADTIPDDLHHWYGQLIRARTSDIKPLVQYEEAIELIERTGRAETRIEVLEAALRDHHLNAISEDQAYQGSEMYERTVAALAAPSGEMGQ